MEGFETMNQKNFEALVIGTDFFGYYWARSFYEKYGVKPHIIGNFSAGQTSDSGIIKEIRIEPDLYDEETFISSIIQYAKDIKAASPDKEIVFVPNYDHFMRYAIEHKEKLDPYMHFNIPNKELLEELMLKEKFYALAEKHGLPIPKTIIQPADQVMTKKLDIYPVVVKPSSAVGWKELKFEGQEKVYVCQDEAHLTHVLQTIREAGYKENLIIQEYIAGGDSQLWDAVSYSNTKGKMQFINLGQVILQEPDIATVGNYTAVIARYDEKIMKQLQNFLDTIGYTGFANFDMKRDPKDGQLKVFEVNIRTGRGSFSAEQMGESLAYHLVEDVLYDNRSETCHYMERENIFTYVPKYVMRRYTKEPELKKEINRLIKENKMHNPLHYSKDRSLKRSIYLKLRDIRYVQKYRKGTWNESMHIKE